MKRFIVGYDIGGTKCSVVLSDASNGICIIDKRLFLTALGKDYSEVRKLLFEYTYELINKHSLSHKDIAAFGIGCGGPLDSNLGMIYSPPNLPGWDDVAICEDIEKEFGTKAYLLNDANACALVEWKLGAGRGVSNMIFLTMGTGFGAGIIAGGALLGGANGMAGEVGHIRLKDNGPEGYGKAGSIEGFCSGAGIAKQAKKYTEEKLANGITPKWIADGLPIEEISAKVISEYAKAGDESAKEIFEAAGRNLGLALAMLIDIFNPERIVIGGIFMRCEDLLRKAMEESVKSEALEFSRRACEILPAKTGEDLGDLASVMTACYQMDIECEPLSYTEKPEVMEHFESLFRRYSSLLPVKEKIMQGYCYMVNAYKNGGKLLICGNGGSAADADHIVGELMKGFYKRRDLSSKDIEILGEVGNKLQGALSAIALTQHNALSTAFANDADPTLVFAQQVYGYGKRGDVLWALSTSGNSKNVVHAVKTAKALGLRTIGMTGGNKSELTDICDICINVPGAKAAEVQELHLPVYHTLCAMLEEEFF